MVIYVFQNGWVDVLKICEEICQEMVELVGEVDNKVGFKIILFCNYNSVINLLLLMLILYGDKVGIVVVKGIILDGECNVGIIGGNSIVRLFCQVWLDNDVKVVVLQVDFFGGSVLVFEIICQEVLNLKVVGKFVVVLMDIYVVFGGYWILIDVDKIFVFFSIIIGLIGVFGMFMIYENSLDYLGINIDGVVIIDMVGLLIVCGLSLQYSQFIQCSVESKYSKFLFIVVNLCDMIVEDVDKIVQG